MWWHASSECASVSARRSDEVEHLDAAAAEDVAEGVVLGLGALEPHDVVEEEVGAVGRREPFETQVRTVDQHRPQLADL